MNVTYYVFICAIIFEYHKIIWYKITSCHIISHHITSHHTVWVGSVPFVTSYHIFILVGSIHLSKKNICYFPISYVFTSSHVRCLSPLIASFFCCLHSLYHISVYLMSKYQLFGFPRKARKNNHEHASTYPQFHWISVISTNSSNIQRYSYVTISWYNLITFNNF